MLYQRDQYAKGGAGHWYWDFRDSYVFSRMLPHNTSILDVGCGEGIALEKLVRMYPDRQVIGVDLELENIKICRKFGLTAVYSDVNSLALPSSRFDFCIMIDILEHLKTPSEAVHEVYRVLRPGGRLVIVIPNDRNFFLSRLALGMIKEAFYEVGHEKQWKPRDVIKLLTDTGFRIAGRKSVPFLFWQTSLHHIVTAEKVLSGGLD
ncbi:MAG: class I SAM-dependent methyltransferase [Syntrophobacterales bacterium]|jgi:2-polyprenyl-3-methyl-5-hydroxy-6-metoxy-1,4-benzoquinol methylase|nr:class I SAM-dependent methyltransferase [Syntrophobacterales bacterium]